MGFIGKYNLVKVLGRIIPSLVLLCLGMPLSAQSGDAPLEISLDSLLNVRISSASKYEQTLSEAPASVTIISRDEIRQYGYSDLSELMNQVRDVYYSFDREYHYIGVRGFNRLADYNNRISVLVNGSPITEAVYGSAPFGIEFWGFNLDAVERVEFLRGPSSALYGSAPMLGIINIVTIPGTALQKVRASAETGSFGRVQGSVCAGAIRGNLDVSGSLRLGSMTGQDLYFAEFDDSSTNHGISNKQDWAKWGGGHFRLAYKGLTWQTVYTNRIVGTSTGSFGVIFNDPNGYNRDRYAHSELKYTHQFSPRLSLTGRLHGNAYRWQGLYQYVDAEGGEMVGITKSEFAGTELRAQWDMRDNNRLVVGGEFLHHFSTYNFQANQRGIQTEQNIPYSTFSLFMQDEYQPFRFLTITGGFRFDYLYLQRKALTPRGAMNFFVSKSTTIKMLYGEAFRAPNVYEYNFGDGVTIKPNPTLSPERIRTAEIALQLKLSPRMQASFSSFRSFMTNLIDQVVDTTDGLIQHLNLAGVNGSGFSAELNYLGDKGKGAYLSTSYQDMRQTDLDIPMTSSPKFQFKFGAYARLFKHFLVSTNGNYQTARSTENGGDVAPFLVLDSQIGFEPNFVGSSTINRVRLYFKVRNLLNAQYMHPASVNNAQVGIPQNGRSYNIKLQFDLF